LIVPLHHKCGDTNMVDAMLDSGVRRIDRTGIHGCRTTTSAVLFAVLL
jgi:hypothetical protein